MKKLFFTLLSILFLSACSVVNVSTDYDPKVDIKSYKTFAILDYDKGDSLINNRVKKALTNELTKKGYKSVSEDKADFYVLYIYSAIQKSELREDYVPMGFGRYGRYRGYYTTSTYHYTEGNFEIRMADAKTHETFWRATGVNNLKTLKTPQERTKYTNEIVKKMLEDYPSLVMKK
jgi:hypothetical protein